MGQPSTLLAEGRCHRAPRGAAIRLRFCLGFCLGVLSFAGGCGGPWCFLVDPGPLAPPEAIEDRLLEAESQTPPQPAAEVPASAIPYLDITRPAEAEPLNLQGLRPAAEEKNSDQDSQRDANANDQAWQESERIPLSLEEVRAASLQGNLDLQVIQVNPNLAATYYSEEVGRFEATFSAALNHRRLDPPPGSVQLGVPPDTVSQSFEPSINVPLYSGGTLSFEEALYRANPHFPGVDPTYDAAYGVRLSQPLLRGAGNFVNTAPIRIAGLQFDAANVQAKFNAILVLAEADRAYWRLYEARRILQITREQLELAARQLGAARKLADAGILADVETLRAESGMQLRADAYIEAQTTTRIRQRDLKRIMLRPDLPFFNPTELSLRTEPQAVGLTLDRQTLVDQALQNRADLIGIQLERAANELRVGVARNGLLPQLQLECFAKLLGTGPSGGDATRQAYDGTYQDAFVGLSTAFPIMSQLGNRARLRRSELELLTTRISQERLRVAIIQQVLDAMDRFEQNWQRILAAERAVVATRATYDAEIRLFQSGQRTGDLVLDAAERFANAQIQQTQALVAYEISKVDLAEATGTLLGYGNVEWETVATPPPRPFPPVEIAPD